MITGCLPCRAAAVRIRVKYLTPLETRTAKNQRAFANRGLTIPRGGGLVTAEAPLSLESAVLHHGGFLGPRGSTLIGKRLDLGTREKEAEALTVP